MAWLILFVASLFEIGWAVGLKYTQGFTRPVPTVLTIGAMAISMYLLAIAARTLPIGTAYAVWVGIGAAGTAALGIWLFKEPVTVARMVFLLMLIVAIVGLKLTGGAAAEALPPVPAGE
ncbi:MAG: DMT family transporter [Phycisphaerales bacterium]